MLKSLLLIFLLLYSATFLDAQDTWVRVYGGTGGEGGHSITTTNDGILITGSTSSYDGDFDGINLGRSDLFVIKFDNNGRILWKRTIGGKSYDWGNSVTTTAQGDVLVAGVSSYEEESENGDIVVAKLDKSGEIRWKKSYGGLEHDECNTIVTVGDGIVISGVTKSNDVDFKGMNQGEDDIFIIRLDQNGNVLWNKTYGGKRTDFGSCLVRMSDNSLLVTGWTSSNDGTFKGMNYGADDVFLLKLDQNGNVLWKKTFGGSDQDLGRSVIATADGGILIAGETESNNGDFEGMNRGSADIFVIKVDSDGVVQWKKTFGGNHRERVTDITSTSDGGILITGETESNDGDFNGMKKGEYDIFVIKLDGNGVQLWTRVYGGTDWDVSNSITTVKDDVLITGMSGSNDGDFKGMNKGDKHIIVMKLNSSGNLVQSSSKSK